MFRKFEKTAYAPKSPIFIWDGDCGFCKYWVLVLKRSSHLNFEPYQESSIFYPDIPEKEFMKASRLIEPSGEVFSGPDSAYKALTYLKSPIHFLHRWYVRYGFFRKLSDRAYSYVAKHRPFMMKLTLALFGKNPVNRKPYWLVVLLSLMALVAVAVWVLI